MSVLAGASAVGGLPSDEAESVKGRKIGNSAAEGGWHPDAAQQWLGGNAPIWEHLSG